MKSQRAGSLAAAPARRAGKVVDEWTFTAPTFDDASRTWEAAVKVCLVNTDDGLTFEARVEGFESVRDSDINRLYQRVQSAMEQRAAAAVGAQWEDWLKVTVSGWDEEASDRNRRASLTIEVEVFKRALDPRSGKVFQLSPDGRYAYELPAPMSHEEQLAAFRDALVDGKRWRLGDPKETAYVKATPENLAALEDARNRLRALRARLAQALSQDAIGDTLSDLASRLPLLAAPVAAQAHATDRG